MTYHDHNVRHSVRVTNNIDWEKFRAHSTRNYHGGKEKLKSCIVHSKMMVLRAPFEKKCISSNFLSLIISRESKVNYIRNINKSKVCLNLLYNVTTFHKDS